MATLTSNSRCLSSFQTGLLTREDSFPVRLIQRRALVVNAESARSNSRIRKARREDATLPVVPKRLGLRPWTEQRPWRSLVCCAQDGPTPEDPNISNPFNQGSSDSPPQPSSLSPSSPPGRPSDAKLVSAVGGSDGGLTGEFCIIEGPDTLQDFARMQMEEIRDNIDSRRNRIFLLMEEIRRLRIQQRLRRLEERHTSAEEEEELLEYPSSIPFFPPLTRSTLKEYYGAFAGLVFCIIMFGGLVAPTLEVKLGLGGTSYEEFIQSIGLPSQLSEVDPIVASFSGGAVGVLSALLVVEVNNVDSQEHKKCMYCHGSGYLTCARCSGSGAAVAADAATGGVATRCPNCAGSAKVMCPTCLCTGRALVTEHDPRIDPFD